MRKLNDDRKVRKYIDEDAPCPSNLLLAYYVRCKKDEIKVPDKIDAFVTKCIEKMLKAYNEGIKPDYDDILGLKFSHGRNEIKESAKFTEMMQIGLAIENSMENEKLKKNKYELAVKKIADKMGFSEDKVKKLYTIYKKDT